MVGFQGLQGSSPIELSATHTTKGAFLQGKLEVVASRR